MNYIEIKNKIKAVEINLKSIQAQKEEITSIEKLNELTEKETNIFIQRNLLKAELSKIADNMKNSINTLKDQKKFLERENINIINSNNTLFDNSVKESIKSIIKTVVKFKQLNEISIPDDIVEYLEDIDDLKTIKELERKSIYLASHNKIYAIQQLQLFCQLVYGNSFIENLEQEVLKETSSKN